MSSTLPVSVDELSAYVDSQLPPDRAAEVAIAIERDPALAAQAALLKRQNKLLRDALDPMLSDALPPALLRAARGGWDRRSLWRRVLPAVAVAASLLIGAGLGWMARGQLIELSGTPVSFQRQAAVTHALYASDVNRPVEIWANEEQRLVNWLSKRLGFAVHAPNLNTIGYSLVGGRLVAGNEKPAALFMYENADKQRISLLVRRDSEHASETGFRYAIENGVGVFYWIDESCGYAISGNVDRTQLLSIAHVVYGQLAASEVRSRQ